MPLAGWITALSVVSWAEHAVAAQWKLAGWTHRKTVKITKESLKTPVKAAVGSALAFKFKAKLSIEKREKGIDAAFIKLKTDGNSLPDGRDLRMYDARGMIVPLEILFSDPKREVLVTFYVAEPKGKFYAYYGNQTAKAKTYKWRCKRGLFLETRPAPARFPRSLSDMQAVIQKSPSTYGMQFNMWIFNHYNPMGPLDRYLSIYRGWVNCPRSGKYTFGTASDAPSFLLIDGKPVAQQIRGRASRRITHTGDVTLTAGAHRIEYYGGGKPGPYRLLGAWKPPGGKNIDVIRFDQFPKIYTAEAVSVDRKGSSVACDFDLAVDQSIPLGETGQVNLYKFKNETNVKGFGRGVKYHWEFGDGTTSDESDPEHVFFEVGDYEVKLKATSNRGGTDEITRIVKIEDFNTVDHELQHAVASLEKNVLHTEHHHSQVYLQVPPEEVEKVARGFLKIVKDYPKDRVCASALLGMIRLFKRMSEGEEIVASCEAYLRRFPNANASALAECCICLGDAYLYKLGKLDQALTAYQEIDSLRGPVDKKLLNRVHVQMGHIHLAKGDVEKAKEQYTRAGAALTRRAAWMARRLKINAAELTVMSAIKRGNLKGAEMTLDAWESDFPEDILRGRSIFLRGKCKYLSGQHLQAVTELQKLEKANPYSSSIPEARLLMGDCCMAVKDYQGAVEHYGVVVSKYPNSPFSKTAEKNLAKAKKRI